MKFNITQDFIPIRTKRRSGRLITKVGFLVAHDSGNPGSTAKNNVTYFKRTCNEQSASAQLFVDDIDIIECIPAFVSPEVAWHVIYNVVIDNEMFGDDANDIAIGVEYCFGDNINADLAYEKYVWVLAYLCYVHELSPTLQIIGHSTLDPVNKIDPENGLSYSGRTFAQLIEDVVREYDNIAREMNPVPSGMFIDIPDGDYAKKAVEALGRLGAVTGGGNGFFYPNDLISRKDVALIVYRALIKTGVLKEES